MTTERQIIFHGEYFQAFYISVSEGVKEKIGYVFRLIQTVEKVPERFLKHMEGSDGLYEIRIDSGGNIYRIFCCFDKGNLVVLFNAFQKKTQKTPPQEVRLARQLMKEYFTLREKQDEKNSSSKGRKKRR